MRSRWHRWLLVLPFIWQLGLAPAVNDVRWAPLHIPFPMLWQLLGVVFASAVIGLVFWLDRRAGVDAEEAELVRLSPATPDPQVSANSTTQSDSDCGDGGPR